MVTREEILEQLYRTGFVQNFTKKFAKANDVENLDDEIQEIFLIACEIPEKRLIEMYESNGINGVRRFLSGVIHRQMNSTTSLIHSKYRKKQETTYSAEETPFEALEEGKIKLENMYKQ